MSFPIIEGVTWRSEIVPDIVDIPVDLEDRFKRELDIPGLEIEQTRIAMTLDLTKITNVRPFFLNESDIPVENECLIELQGGESMVISLPRKNIEDAWIFSKEFKHATRNT